MNATPAPQVLDTVDVERGDEIGPAELKRKLDRDEDVLLLDVRGPEEFEEWHIPGAVNIPLGQLQSGADLPAREDQTIVTVCAAGVRSARAQEILSERGYEAYNLHDGMMGWNRVFNVVDANAGLTGDAQVLQFQRTGKGCLSYMVLSDGEALVVDPARDWTVYEQTAQAHGADIVAVVDTHAHADHVSGGPGLAHALGVDYHLHPYDAIHPIDMLPAEIDYTPLIEDETLQVGNVSVRALHIPGHTLGNLALVVDEEAVFTGDSVFISSIARPDLGGEAEAWTPMHYASLNKVLDLPRDTVILPGHFGSPEEATDGVYAAELSTVIANNEGLQMAQKDLDTFRAFILDSLPSFPERYVDIKRVNAGILDADEDKIQDLEFGQQECAVSE